MWNVYVIIAMNTFIYYYITTVSLLKTDQNKSSSTGAHGPVALPVEN